MSFCQDDDCTTETEIDASRSDARYCSAACKQRSYRRRQRDAAAFRAEYGDYPDRALQMLGERLRGLPGWGRVTDSGADSRNGPAAQ